MNNKTMIGTVRFSPILQRSRDGASLEIREMEDHP